ncbi:lipopolysaccharide assembly protein LapA domain-containing protein [Aliikangiella sp. IMCC44653]
MKNFIIIIIALILFIVSALFFAQNDGLVTINYIYSQVEWQLNWVMVLCLLLGFLVGIGALVGGVLKTKLQLKQANNKLRKLESELNSLRALPIKDDY